MQQLNFRGYFDSNATSPYSPSVKDYLITDLTTSFANASSNHDKGYDQFIKIKQTRSLIADFLDTDPGNLIFTSSATESIMEFPKICGHFLLNGKIIFSELQRGQAA